MKSTRNLHRRLRVIEGALVLLLGALTTGAVATHQLLLDATNRPVGDVDFSGPHWIGTLDAARLPASVPLLDGTGSLAISGALSAAGGITEGDDGGRIDTTNGGGVIDTSYGGGGIYTSYGGGIYTSYGGGYIVTDGSGVPTDSGAPLGSLYMDQDPDGTSGHVLWVMERSGWAGK